MSEHLPLNPNTDPPPGSGNQLSPAWRANRQRRASVTLRQDGGDDMDSLMDPATQSLSDALRITYKFVILAVIVLAVIYIFSGFRRVHEGERGMRLLFGRVVSEDIDPGFRLSWPEPFGELITVRTGAQSIALDEDFFPQLTEDEKKQFRDKGAQALVGGGFGKLNPEVDGSLVTGDGNLAHTRWAITYHRETPKLVEENIDSDFERSIVVAACKRGIIRAVASVSIDELLKNTPDEWRQGEWRSVESVAREIAQETLDKMESGIRIDQLSLTAKIPPRRVMPAFNEVLSSNATSAQMRDQADEYRRGLMTSTAGDAAGPILQQIELYGKQVELKNEEEAAKILERVDALLEGNPVTIDGKQMNPRVYGKVTTVLSEANRDRWTYVANLAGEVDRFTAKLESYQKNPLVLLNSEWADAYGSVVARQNIQTVYLPQLKSNGKYVLNFNTDPQISQDIIAALNKQKAEKAEEIRKKQQEAQRFREKVTPLNTRTE